jgi:hypothetical protein
MNQREGPARPLIKRRRISIGKAASDLLRKSADISLPTKEVNGLILFNLPADSPRVTSERVYKLLEAES